MTYVIWIRRADGTWEHLAMVWDALPSVFINGERVEALDDPVLFRHRALTPDEVQHLYRCGRGTTYEEL